jgi:hypothetical protein
MRRMANYTWQDHKTNEDILSELKIKVVVTIQNYRNKWVRYVRRMDRDRQTATFHYAVSTTWETKPRTTPQKIS